MHLLRVKKTRATFEVSLGIPAAVVLIIVIVLYFGGKNILVAVLNALHV
ncbi:MAG: hypothetical protein ACR2IV_11780 [Bryobacteraceae bacterium]